MNDWGWNPSTFQAAGGIATAIALIFLIGSFWISAKQSRASIRASAVAERESNLRTRPWLTFDSLEFIGGDLRIVFSNIGALPALDHGFTFPLDLSSTRSLAEILSDLDSRRDEIMADETMVVFPKEQHPRTAGSGISAPFFVRINRRGIVHAFTGGSRTISETADTIQPSPST